MSWLHGIYARGLRHLGRLELDVRSRVSGRTRPRHLAITGPNGSGKTLLIEAIVDEIEAAIEAREHPGVEVLTRNAPPDALDAQLKLAHFSRPMRLTWSRSVDEIAHAFRTGRWIAAYVPAERDARFAAAAAPVRTDGDPKRPRERVGARFSSLLASKRDELEVSTESRDRGAARRAEEWFAATQTSLARLLHQPQLALAHDRDGFHLDLPDGRRMHFDQLSRGHAQAVAIWAEIAMRVEAARRRVSDPAYQPDGVVCIDAPELDLDVRLQRELLAAITALHPKLQLVVATHSPWMATSLEDALVFDVGTGTARASAELRAAGVESLADRMLGADPIATRPSVPPPTTKKVSSAPPRETLGLPPKPAPAPLSSKPPAAGVPKFIDPRAGIGLETVDDGAWPPPAGATPVPSGPPPAWSSDSLSASGSNEPAPARTLAEAAAMAAERRVPTPQPPKGDDRVRGQTLTGANPWAPEDE